MNVLGIGFRQAATIKSFRSAMSAISFSLNIDLIAVPSDKSNDKELLHFSELAGIKVMGISEDLLFQQETKTKSKMSKVYRKVDSVAEAAALAGAGNGSRLVVHRVVSKDGCVTAAIAKSYKNSSVEKK